MLRAVEEHPMQGFLGGGVHARKPAGAGGQTDRMPPAKVVAGLVCRHKGKYMHVSTGMHHTGTALGSTL